VLEFTATGVHLYDRSEEALVPVATRGVESVLGRPPGSYTDRGSVVWETYRSESPTTIDDTERLEGRLPNEETETRSGMLFPLGDHGVLITSSAVTDGFDDSDRYFGGLLATMLRTALDRVGRERTLGRIQRLTGRFVAADDPAEVCEMLAEGAAEAIGLPVAGVWRHDRFDDRLVPVASTSEADDLVGDPPAFESGDSLAWQVFAAGEPRLFDDVTDESAVHNPDSPIVTEMIVPIEGFGVAAAGSPVERDFSETEFELFRTLVTGAESALRIVEQREELSVLDQILARVLRHNVRNDLSTIRGRAEVIAGRADGPVAGQARQIIETSDELLSTTEHAREMREAVDRREERTEIDLSRAVRTAVEGVRADHPSASIHVDADALCLQAHPDLSRAIRHAIENGVEHNDGPEPTVRVSTTRATDGVTLAVADDGPGIPDHELEPLSAEEETALSHGSGVGVWLIDRIVRYSGGSVAFDVDERGTTVSMRFDRSAVVE
jgi:signal transduction histidine kinase